MLDDAESEQIEQIEQIASNPGLEEDARTVMTSIRERHHFE
jgi:hypothetical protein